MAKARKKPAAAAPVEARDAVGQLLSVGAEVMIAAEYEKTFHQWSRRIGTVESIEPNGDRAPIVYVQFPANTRFEPAYAQVFANELVAVVPTALGPELPAPGPAVHHALQYVPLASIDIVRNTRTVYDEAELAELTESVRAKGVIQPVTMRPHPEQEGRYQLAAGHRRYLASERAGLLDIPASIRPMTDHELLEIQVLENLQRANIRPSDEALAFAELLRNDFTPEEIGLRVGKPAKFVLQRAKLAELVPFWMTALQEDRLPLAAAHELARLPVASQEQARAIPDQYGYDQSKRVGVKYTVEQVRKYISQEIMRDLHQAAFPKADPTLNPEMGACTTCPHHTGAFKLLFDDQETGRDCCLIAACFAKKKTVYVERRAELLKEKNGKEPVLISTAYTTKLPGVVPLYNYSKATATSKKERVVEALVVDGPDAGKLLRVELSSGAKPLDSAQVAEQAAKQKQEDAAKIRQNRVQRVTNELLAEALRDTFNFGLTIDGDGTRNLLVHFVRKSIMYGRTAVPKDTVQYLVQRYRFKPPVGDELNNQYRSGEPSLHEQYLEKQLRQLAVLELVSLFFDLKFREKMEYEHYSEQMALAKLLPGGGPDVSAEAQRVVQERFYTPRKKGAPVEQMTAAIEAVMQGEEVSTP